MQGQSFAGSKGAWIWIAVASGTASLAGGAAYAWASWNSPLILLNVGLTLLVGWLVGWAVAKTAIRRGVTSHPAIVLAGVVAGTATLYAAWSVYGMLVIPGIGAWAFDPRFLYAFVQDLRDFGAIAIDGEHGRTKIEGGGMVALWIGEAAALIGAAAVAAHKQTQAAGPVCQACRTRKVERFGILRCEAPEDLQQFATDLCAGRDGRLDDLSEATVDDDEHMRIDIVWCPSCHQDCSMSVAHLDYSRQPAEIYICRHEPLPMTTLARILDLAKENDVAGEESATSASP